MRPAAGPGTRSAASEGGADSCGSPGFRLGSPELRARGVPLSRADARPVGESEERWRAGGAGLPSIDVKSTAGCYRADARRDGTVGSHRFLSAGDDPLEIPALAIHAVVVGARFRRSDAKARERGDVGRMRGGVH